MSLVRRRFLQTSTAAAIATVPYFHSARPSLADETRSANDRPRFAAIGLGRRGSGIAGEAARYADAVAICDVDSRRRERPGGKGKAEPYEDYRRVLDRQDVDFVTIGTPDHWHVKIAIDAMRAGKDVYCEKPLTLTIDEGVLISKVVRETGRVMQVGTQQRSDFDLNFITAVAMVREGRIGKIQRVTCAIGGGKPSGKLMKQSAPPQLNWDMWLGQCPMVDYIEQRCHYDFRWWYEYSGGKLTDWGAHHVDIAHWALGLDATGPTSFEVLSCTHPVPFKKGWPTVDDEYNTALAFHVLAKTRDGVEIHIRDEAKDLGFPNGILFEGEAGRILVNRGKLTGAAVDALKDKPIADETFRKLRHGKANGSHMANFIDCTRDRGVPVSDVASHHRAMTTCHLANIAMRLGRSITWDPVAEMIVGDDEARAFQKREQRKGYEIA